MHRLSSDEKPWERKDPDGEVIISCPVENVRFAILFELARIMDKGVDYIDNLCLKLEATLHVTNDVKNKVGQ